MGPNNLLGSEKTQNRCIIGAKERAIGPKKGAACFTKSAKNESADKDTAQK